MNLDEQVRATLVASTEDVVGGPDLGRAVQEGRRRRRRRSVTLGVAALAVTGLALGTAYQVTRGPSHETARDRTPVATAPAYQDFVPGSDVDETLQDAVARHLPGITPATDVYASDWNHDNALPASQAQNATDWEGFYAVSANDRLAVAMSKKIPGGVRLDECSDISHTTDQPACDTTRLGDGSTLVIDSYTLVQDVPSFWFTTTLTRPDGSVITANQKVAATTWAEALARRAYDPTQTSALVEDAAMTFPDPVVTPPPPSSP